MDNRINPGRTIPIKLRVTCNNVFVPDAVATVEDVVRLEGDGTPVANEVVEDAGNSSGDTGDMRVDLKDEHYIFNLSTQGWASESGARFRVTVRIRRQGHVDTVHEIYLVNR